MNGIGKMTYGMICSCAAQEGEVGVGDGEDGEDVAGEGEGGARLKRWMSTTREMRASTQTQRESTYVLCRRKDGAESGEGGSLVLLNDERGRRREIYLEKR